MLVNAPLVWGEIPVSDMERAITFYQQQFGLSFTRQTSDELDMAIVETADPEAASFALIKHPEIKPSMDGSMVYLNFSEHLSPLVEKITTAGVSLLVPITPINEGECGYFSVFIDCEGNKVGLWAKLK